METKQEAKERKKSKKKIKETTGTRKENKESV